MPPVTYIDKAVATNPISSMFDIAIPATARADLGDSLVFIAIHDNGVSMDPDNAGWDVLEELTVGTVKLIIGARRILDTDPASLDVVCDGPFAWSFGVGLVYRGLSSSTPIEHTGAVIAATTNFACPSRTAVAYSNFYIGIAGVTSAATAVAPPAGATERDEQQAGGRTFEVFDHYPEAVGATGAKTATTGANQSGIAASVLYAANGIPGVGKRLSFDPPGVIGLPEEGV